MLNPVTWKVHAFPVFFGGTVVSEDGYVISVPSLQLIYFANADNKKMDKRWVNKNVHILITKLCVFFFLEEQHGKMFFLTR